MRKLLNEIGNETLDWKVLPENNSFNGILGGKRREEGRGRAHVSFEFGGKLLTKNRAKRSNKILQRLMQYFYSIK